MNKHENILTEIKKQWYSCTNETFQKRLFMEGMTNNMTKKQKVTITQVAKQAGVSVGTVSNYLNRTVSVSQDRADRIQKVIDELDYIPDTLASSLRRKNSKMIFVLTPNLKNVYYANIIASLMECAYKTAYEVHISSYEYQEEREKMFLRSLETSKPGTIVIIFNGYNDEKAIRRLIKKDIHVILADRVFPVKDTSSVVFDNRDVIYEIVRMLKDKKYRSIGFFAELTELQNIKKRRESFIEAMKFYGYENPERFIYENETLSIDKLKNSYLYMKEILETNKKEDLPEAWFATSDYLAVGMMRAIKEKGYTVPGDFGIVGFDNIDLSDYSNPRLTTVEQDQELFGRKLWDLIKRTSQSSKKEEIILPQKVITRESC